MYCICYVLNFTVYLCTCVCIAYISCVCTMYVLYDLALLSGSRRRSVDAVRQMYLSRNTLHHELQLPDGYGTYSRYCHDSGNTLNLSRPEQRVTAQGQVYFIHRATGVSTWHDPRFR